MGTPWPFRHSRHDLSCLAGAYRSARRGGGRAGATGELFSCDSGSIYILNASECIWMHLNAYLGLSWSSFFNVERSHFPVSSLSRPGLGSAGRLSAEGWIAKAWQDGLQPLGVDLPSEVSCAHQHCWDFRHAFPDKSPLHHGVLPDIAGCSRSTRRCVKWHEPLTSSFIAACPARRVNPADVVVQLERKGWQPLCRCQSPAVDDVWSAWAAPLQISVHTPQP